MSMLKSETNHQFLRTLSADVVRGQAAAASEGKWIGIPPRGFKIGTDGKLALGHQDDIDQSIDKAERNMLACSPDMVARFEKRIRQLEAERIELTAELKTARLPRNQQFRSVDEKIDQAIKLYSSLRETLERADMQLLRSFIKEAIDHVVVDVKTTHNVRGRQHGYQLLGGAIHMRSTNLCTKSRLREQVIRFKVTAA